MKVAILGTGGVGLGYAAFLHTVGHKPVLWSPSGRGVATFRDGNELVAEGALATRFTPATATDPGFVAEADAVVVAAPAYAYRAIFGAVLAHLRPEQPLIISAHLSLAAHYAARLLAARGVTVPVVAWGTTVLMGRKTGPSSVEIGGIRGEVDAAVVPTAQADAGLAACIELFGARFRRHANLMAVQLGNLNPPIHLAVALCNLTRIERGEAWSNYGGITQAVARLIEALDRERLDVAVACGMTVRSVEQHYQRSFGFAPGESLAAMAAEIDRRRGGKPPGPTTLDTRFVTEDVPFGIVPLIRIAAHLGVAVPLHEAGLAMISALYGRDFAAGNDILSDAELAAAIPPPAPKR